MGRRTAHQNTHVHIALDRRRTDVHSAREEEMSIHTQQVVIGVLQSERFTEADVAIFVAANDVVNPGARTSPASPIFGMPILKVEDAKSVFVLKRGKDKGFSGVENELLVGPKTSMLCGGARQSLLDLALRVKVA
jgi:NAD/NADP transhydrogenase beta subunit